MSLTKIDKIAQVLLELKEPSFRQKQIKYAIYQKGILDSEQMLTLPLSLRQKLKEKLGNVLTLKFLLETKDGQANKVLFETADGAKIEAVKMTFNPNSNEQHESVCISSMSGCNLGCRFCSTGTMGLRKMLSADEIVDQVLFFKNRDHFQGSISFMGMGEPLMNVGAVFQALKILTDKEAFNFSDRKINISTVGIIPAIERLTREYPQINLAFSLHSPFNEERSEIMPVNKLYPLNKVMTTLTHHIKKTKRRIFLAYLLLKDVNDSPKHARALIDLIKSQGELSYLYFVNLINFHPGDKNIPFHRSSTKTVTNFINFLKAEGINYSLRQSFGIEIGAACGQLCVKQKN